MCKNPQTLPLLEVTGSVAERYKTQAARCPIPLLFEGINLLTAVDSSLRTASNQRLHVELGLMKLCGLGQKKNDDTLTPQLPPLRGQASPHSPAQPTPAQHPTGRTSGHVTPPPTPTVPSSPHPTVHTAGAPTAPSTPTSQPSTSIRTAQTMERSTPIASAHPTVSPAAPASTPLAAPHTSQPASPTHTPAGRCLYGIRTGGNIDRNRLPSDVDSFGTFDSLHPQRSATRRHLRCPRIGRGHNAEEESTEIDDTVEETLTQGCARFARSLMEKRPRMGNIFQEATVTGNRVLLKVPNESSYDELMHSLSEMKMQLTEISGLHVPIEFDNTRSSVSQRVKTDQSRRPSPLSDAKKSPADHPA